MSELESKISFPQGYENGNIIFPVGMELPILQHLSCIGATGVVVEKGTKDPFYVLQCTTCNRSGMIPALD